MSDHNPRRNPSPSKPLNIHSPSLSSLREALSSVVFTLPLTSSRDPIDTIDTRHEQAQGIISIVEASSSPSVEDPLLSVLESLPRVLSFYFYCPAIY